jgi:benzoyl-CoA reductase/2-hydroxyglutaryl-CoA dehydratase subunit BcrC/BadD/HgdB
MDKAEHRQLAQKLMTELKKNPAEEWAGKRVVLTGIMAEPDEFLDILSENGLAVVADDLAQESRQFRVDVPRWGRSPGKTGSPLEPDEWLSPLN